ncbi:MAG: anion permease, partial [Alphaproteobacteria bacterium]|nr:anion permease [Alphaproteobacteria bacterium]
SVAATPMPGAQRRLAVVLALALALFATDFLHGVSPAWVALGAGIVCLLPAMQLVSPKLLAERSNINALIFVAGFLGVGAVVADSGLGEALSRQLLAWASLSPGNGAANLATLAAIGAVLGLVTTLPALPAVLTPLAGEMAAASGLPLESVLMLQVVVFSSVLLPYQVPPIMVAMHLGKIGIRDGAKLFLAMAALTVAFLLPLDYLWWRLLGYAP